MADSQAACSSHVAICYLRQQCQQTYHWECTRCFDKLSVSTLDDCCIDGFSSLELWNSFLFFFLPPLPLPPSHLPGVTAINMLNLKVEHKLIQSVYISYLITGLLDRLAVCSSWTAYRCECEHEVVSWRLCGISVGEWEPVACWEKMHAKLWTLFLLHFLSLESSAFNMWSQVSTSCTVFSWPSTGATTDVHSFTWNSVMKQLFWLLFFFSKSWRNVTCFSSCSVFFFFSQLLHYLILFQSLLSFLTLRYNFTAH